MQKNSFFKHFSFFVMIFTSASLYISNIVLAKFLTPSDYGFYALLISFVSIVASFGFFGIDQAIVRTASLESDAIAISSKLVKLAFAASSVFAIFSYLYFYSFGVDSAVLSVVSTVGVTVGLAGYAWGRLSKSFVFAQFSHGGHRLLFGLSLLFTWLLGFSITIQLVEWVLAISAVLVGVFSVLFFIRHGSVSLKSGIEEPVMAFALGYGLSMLIMNTIGFADRFLVERLFGLELAAAFFFYANIYVFPFALLQNYVGFRELANYKERFTIKILHQDLLKAIKIYLVVLIACIIADFVLTKYFLLGIFDLTFTERILLACVGCARILYGALSAAFGAVASSSAIHRVNLATVLVGVVLFGVFLLMFEKSLAGLILFFLAVWFARASSIYLLVCKGRTDAV